MRRFTKTFVEDRYYDYRDGEFIARPRSVGDSVVRSLDVQIQDWVEATGSIIIHPGQLGMSTTWYGDADNQFKVKCVTFGLTVLYQEPDANGGSTEPAYQADPSGIDRGAATADPSPVTAYGGGGLGGPYDRAGTS